MFVYQNKAGNICVTFVDTKPVEAPEYVIEVDEEARTISIVGEEAQEPEVTDNTAELEAQIAALEADIVAKDETIADQAKTIAEKDARIAELEAAAE